MTKGQRAAMVVLGTAISVVSALLLIPAPPEGSREGYRPLFPDLDTMEITQLELRNPSWPQDVTLRRTDGGWRLEEPVEGRADSAFVEAMLDELVSLEVREALDGGGLDAFGLDPAARIELSFVAEDAAPVTLGIGAETLDMGTYLLHEGQAMPASGSIGRAVPASFDDLRDRSPWFHSTTAAIALSVEARSGARWRVELGTEGWRLDATEGGELDPSLPPRLLRELDGLAISTFSESQPPAEPPLLELVLRDRDGAVQRVRVHELRDGVPSVEVPAHAGLVTLERGSLETFTDLVGLD
jgi:hypothetical protein